MSIIQFVHHEKFINQNSQSKRIFQTIYSRTFSFDLAASPESGENIFLIGIKRTRHTNRIAFMKQEEGKRRILNLNVGNDSFMCSLEKHFCRAAMRKLFYVKKRQPKPEIENPFTYQLTLHRCLTLWSISDHCFYFPCLIGC